MKAKVTLQVVYTSGRLDDYVWEIDQTDVGSNIHDFQHMKDIIKDSISNLMIGARYGAYISVGYDNEVYLNSALIEQLRVTVDEVKV